MDCANHGTLKQFGDAGGIIDQLTVKFTRELCTAIAYMHGKGVSHGDVHIRNILVFTAPGGGYTAKWTDFGLAVSRDVFARWGHELTPRVMYKWARADTTYLQKLTKYMLDTCANTPGIVCNGPTIRPHRTHITRTGESTTAPAATEPLQDDNRTSRTGDTAFGEVNVSSDQWPGGRVERVSMLPIPTVCLILANNCIYLLWAWALLGMSSPTGTARPTGGPKIPDSANSVEYRG
ncbi:unnamed protein product [Medioppia subpectinata]|uniref:Protein kinase domain-containing protein n=1 Tax=Medioppia subpectinata TaxID=1979941 RepID=A0A7R9KE37_9ACAR|nr:unnamed protein product [Medioppia subpectinata]CAG2101651.1 unnamed protein product [Medioppia subpectinata]